MIASFFQALIVLVILFMAVVIVSYSPAVAALIIVFIALWGMFYRSTK